MIDAREISNKILEIKRERENKDLGSAIEELCLVIHPVGWHVEVARVEVGKSGNNGEQNGGHRADHRATVIFDIGKTICEIGGAKQSYDCARNVRTIFNNL